MPLNWIDYVILGIVVFSALVSVLRGIVREIMSLAGWVAAVWLARTGMEPVSQLLESQIPAPSVRMGTAFALVFIATLFVVGLLNFIIGRLIAGSGLSGTDRVLGIAFGAARGVLIVGILVLIAGLTPLPKDSWWHTSLLLPHFQEMALWMRSHLPAELASYISY